MRYHRLDLNLIIVLEAMLRHGSVAKVADELYLTPPAVSNSLARLRSHFNNELFISSGRRMQPTAFASGLRVQVTEMLAKAREIATAHAQFDPANATRNFSIAVSDYAAQNILPNLLPRLRRMAPGVNLAVVNISEDSIVQFQRGDIDLLVAPEDIVPPTRQSCLLFEDQFVAVAWKNSTWKDSIDEETYFNAAHILAEPATYVPIIDGATQLGRTNSDIPSKLEQFFALKKRQRRIALRLPFFFLVPPALICTDLLATLPLRSVMDHPCVSDLRIIHCNTELPVLREHLHLTARLAQDPGGRWLHAMLEEVADKAMRSRQGLGDSTPAQTK